ncbi:hypothetical protein ACWEOE_10660 [Amycolatopsis sp. NPDC004368]
MSELVPASGGSPFDRIKQTRPDGSEFWSARQLQGLMGYARWANLSPAIARAQQAASNTGMDVPREFAQVEMLTGSRNPSDSKADFELSRQAAYLVAMNGDPNKPEVAAAQAYFAVRTMQAEAPAQQLQGISAIRAMLDVIEATQSDVLALQQGAKATEARVDSLEGNYGEFTALGYAKLNDLPTDRPSLAQLGKRAARVMRAAGEEPRRRQDATFGLINVYPTWALDAALAELTDDAA